MVEVFGKEMTDIQFTIMMERASYHEAEEVMRYLARKKAIAREIEARIDDKIISIESDRIIKELFGC